jgi:DNA recombination protein RmuC
MEILLGAVLGVVGAAAVALVVLRSTRRAPDTPVEPALDPEALQTQVGRTVGDALTRALDELAERARKDREESIKMATDLITKAGVEQLGGRADLINTTMQNVKGEVNEHLKRIDAALTSLQAKSAAQHENMEKVVATLAQRTDNLREILSNSQARGQWGERLAEDMLRAAGFMEGINYHKQSSIEGGGRPDYRFDMPPDRVLFMDVKFPLDKYVEYVNATSDTERDTAKKDFLRAVTGHVSTLAKRDYVDKATDNTIDYVLMFVPNEGISGFVHEVSPDLIDQALAQKVILCSPLTLYAFLVVIRQAAESFHTERTAADVMRLINLFNKQWDEYTKAVESVSKSFHKLQDDMESISTGGTRYNKLNVQVKAIEKMRKQQGVPELTVGESADALYDD